ncbi:hypothetical protein JH146_0773 [Methanocaldococcus bathoardescens]|uniref:Uncharacterized protein n=1 Tax=Methanocaldococcus bathoardescens TaxID=1301915 RepID=A0A076LJ93_9EURY|nr:hypothetical protein JH146_0773 [Methanocaldococcus bathoardescens]
MLIFSTEYPDSLFQSIILFLTSIPFSILIYGYVGLVIKNILNNNNSLPSWKNLKSIILMGFKINAILLFVLLAIFMFYFLKSYSIFDALGDILYILWIFYYPMSCYNITIALMSIMYVIFCPSIYSLALILVIPIALLLILNFISNGIKNILNLGTVKKFLCLEYFKVLFVIFIYFLISNLMYVIYAYITITDFNLSFALQRYFIFSDLSLESLILIFIRKFIQFYFLVVIGKTLGNYAKKHK